MTEKKKNILLAVLIVGVVSMTVAFAALSQNLNINGSASVQNLSDSWNIHFAHISNTANEIKTSGYATTPSSSITLDNTTVTVPEVTLKAPGDKVEYIFKVVNEGDIKGYINVLENIGFGTITYDKDETLTQEQKTSFQNDIQVTLTYNDNSKTRLAYNDELAKNEEKELILTIEYINRASDQTMPSKDVTFTGIRATITYGQDRTSLSGNGPAASNPSVVQPSAKPTMSEMCPGCVFAQNSSSKNITSGLAYTPSDKKINSVKYMVNESNIKAVPMEDGATTSDSSDPYTLTPDEYTSSYSNYSDGEAFCLEGYDTSKYSNNIDILNHFFPSCNADASDSDAYCDGSSLSSAYADSDGNVHVNPRSGGCDVDRTGNASC